MTEVVKSSRSRAKFSIPLDRDLRLFWLFEGGSVVGRRYPFLEFEFSARNKNYPININILRTALLFISLFLSNIKQCITQHKSNGIFTRDLSPTPCLPTLLGFW